MCVVVAGRGEGGGYQAGGAVRTLTITQRAATQCDFNRDILRQREIALWLQCEAGDAAEGQGQGSRASREEKEKKNMNEKLARLC